MILNILLTFHIVISCLLVLFILLNKGKGSEIGATFSNSNSSILNTKDSSALLKKIIIALAIVFLISILSINLINKTLINNQEQTIVNLLNK